MFITVFRSYLLLPHTSFKLYCTKKMKQKVVIRVNMSDPKKTKAQAMKIAATFPGVESVAIKGENKDRLEVIGNEIDTVQLAKMLRKKIGTADLISVGPAKDDLKNKIDEMKIKAFCQGYGSNSYPYNYYCGGQVPSYQPVYEVRDSYNDPNCSIM